MKTGEWPLTFRLRGSGVEVGCGFAGVSR
jgi:hypothetical protein